MGWSHADSHRLCRNKSRWLRRCRHPPQTAWQQSAKRAEVVAVVVVAVTDVCVCVCVNSTLEGSAQGLKRDPLAVQH
jgi:hypothetical protein